MRSRQFRSAITTLLLAVSPVIPVHEVPDLMEQPLWELGLGAGGTYTPDYPGSGQSHLWGIPFPYAVYRGEILHSDRRGGTRARLLHTASYELNFSGAGALPSNSAGNVARAGMPNLEWLGEIGPRLMFELLPFANGNLLRLGLPIRVALSSNFIHLRDQGLVFAPELLYDIPGVFNTRFDAFTLLTVTFADRRFNRYFYEVRPEFATPVRPAYRARGGYMLSSLSAGLTMPVESLGIKLFGYATVDSLEGAANSGSPLVKSRMNTSISLVMIWVFGKSARKVFTDD